MEDLTLDWVLEVHERIAEECRCDHRIVSEAGLHQMVFRANLVPGCIHRAALVFYTLCAYPSFREGNEKTALAVSMDILASGGYRVVAEPAALLDLAEGIRDFVTEQEDVDRWLLENTRECISTSARILPG